MVNVKPFKDWLKTHTSYSDAVIRDIASRVKRADSILVWNGEDTYQFYLEQQEQYQSLSVSVRSQIKKAVHLYREYSIQT